jgi:predicted Zn-ribbon and HTH transcriptional regulator
MAKVKLTVWGYRCERCEHEWVPRDTENEPRVCPKCKSPYWNRPRKQEKPEPQPPNMG